MTAEDVDDQRRRAIPQQGPSLGTGAKWQAALFILVALLVGIPLGFLVLGSFSDTHVPTEIPLSSLGLANYRDVWLDPGTYTLFYNTLVYVAGATLIGITIATSLAWGVERTNLPGKIWIYAGIIMTLAMPGMLQAMAWVLLLSPRIGFLNGVIKGLGLPPINIYSLGGMIFVEGLRLVPTAFLMLVPLLRSMDPTLEEAASMSGAGSSAVLRRVTLRLMAPGIVAVVIYQAMSALEVFEVPGILGMPSNIFVFSTKIYAIGHAAYALPEFGKANALAMIYVVIAVFATMAYTKVIAHQERYTIVTGKGYRTRRADLGRGRWVVLCGALLYLTLAVLLPFLVFAYISLMPFVQAPSREALDVMNWDGYRAIFLGGEFGPALWNTVLLVVVTATGTVVLSFLISLVVVRSQFVGRRLLDQIAFAPQAIPGIVLGIAFLWVFLQGENIGVHLFGTVWSMEIAFIVTYIAYGTRAMNAAILQIHKDLEEAAQVSGAPYWRTLWRVFFPLILPASASLWIWVMLHVVRSASVPLMLFEGNDNRVFSVVVWMLWSQGEIQEVGAFGVLMIVGLMLFTLAARALVFGSSYIQHATRQHDGNA